MTHGGPPTSGSAPRSSQSPASGNGQPRLQLSPAQVLASSAAAVSAAVVASFFGVAGSLIGAAVTSVVATVATALYSHSLQVTRQRVRQRLPRPSADGAPSTRPGVVRTAVEELRHHARRLPWRAIAVGTVTVFLLALAALTLVEGLLGRTMAALLGRDAGGKGGTTIGRAVGISPRAASPSPSPSPSAVPTTASPSPSSASPSTGETPTASPSGESGSPSPDGGETSNAPAPGPETPPPTASASPPAPP